MEVHLIAFKNNISEKVLRSITARNKHFINSNLKYIKNFVNEFQIPKETNLVIGLGAYFGKDQKKLRVETVAKNEYKGKVISEGPAEYEISLKVFQNANLEYSTDAGDTYCNLLSYLMAQKIEQSENITYFIFIHIPKAFDINTASSEITRIINKFH